MEIRGTSSFPIGNLNFAAPQLYAKRTADGFHITIEAKLVMHRRSDDLVPMIRGLRGTISAIAPRNHEVEIGRLEGERLIAGASLPDGNPVTLDWRGSFAALGYYEKLRNGKPPVWKIDLTGEAYLLTSEPDRPWRLDRAPDFWCGSEEVKVHGDHWAAALRQLGVVDLVAVQVPLPASPPSGLERVWESVRKARDAFEEGGNSGWTHCCVHVRQALTDWNTISPLNQVPAGGDKTNLTKEQRLDKLRYHLRFFCHVAEHPDPAIAESWTRDDALLALSTLCALLNAKMP